MYLEASYMILHYDSESVISDNLQSWEEAMEELAEFCRQDVLDGSVNSLKEAKEAYYILPE